VFIGQHSLHVFSWHVLVFCLVSVLVEGRVLGEAARTAILIAGIASLAIPAYFHSWLQARERRSRHTAEALRLARGLPRDGRPEPDRGAGRVDGSLPRRQGFDLKST
jgi:peptidoglycan/LPS O-acetylase OafA/YrhL